jgi:hypothetical protein
MYGILIKFINRTTYIFLMQTREEVNDVSDVETNMEHLRGLSSAPSFSE